MEEKKECYKIDFWKSFGNVILNDNVKDGGTNIKKVLDNILKEKGTDIFYINEKNNDIKRKIFNTSKQLDELLNNNLYIHSMRYNNMFNFINSIKTNQKIFNYLKNLKDKYENYDEFISYMIVYLYNNYYLEEKDYEEIDKYNKILQITDITYIKDIKDYIKEIFKSFDEKLININLDLYQIICPLHYLDHSISLSIIKLDTINLKNLNNILITTN